VKSFGETKYDFYKGAFYEGTYHGVGKFWFKEGDYFEGMFHRG